MKNGIMEIWAKQLAQLSKQVLNFSKTLLSHFFAFILRGPCCTDKFIGDDKSSGKIKIKR
jgi:hypothetical protein